MTAKEQAEECKKAWEIALQMLERMQADLGLTEQQTGGVLIAMCIVYDGFLQECQPDMVEAFRQSLSRARMK